MTDPFDLSRRERDALHELQLGTEQVHRAYGHLLAFHHAVGRGMDHFDEAERLFRDTGHTDPADELRDRLLPAGVVDDSWSYELVESFQSGFYRDVTAFEDDVRRDLADGVGHVTERNQQRRWRDRAAEWPPDG
jgi:hypothetical protein